MDVTRPLGTIKDLTTGALTKGVTLPIRLVAMTFGVARGAASVGVQVAQDLAGRRWSAPVDTEPAEGVDVSEPVNVVEELGLDPAPVAEPATGASDTEEPLTGIDAQADPEDVDATPADVAERISATSTESLRAE